MKTNLYANSNNIPSSSDSEIIFIQSILQRESEVLKSLTTIAEIESNEWNIALNLIDSAHGRVIVSGMGKSGLIGNKIAASLSSLGQPSFSLHPAEAFHGDLGAITKNDVVILMSYSGETNEVVNLGNILKHDSIQTIGLSKNNKTLLSKIVTTHLSIGEIDEADPLQLAPTASTTAMLAMGDSLALALARRRSFTAEDFFKRHPGGSLGYKLRPITEAMRFVCGKNVLCLTSSYSLGKALKEWNQKQKKTVRTSGAILIVDNKDRLTGIFTDGDLRRLMIESAKPMELTLGEIATNKPVTISENATIKDAQLLIAQHRIDELPVINSKGIPLGLVDVQDLLAPPVVQK